MVQCNFLFEETSELLFFAFRSLLPPFHHRNEIPHTSYFLLSTLLVVNTRTPPHTRTHTQQRKKGNQIRLLIHINVLHTNTHTHTTTTSYTHTHICKKKAHTQSSKISKIDAREEIETFSSEKKRERERERWNLSFRDCWMCTTETVQMQD